MAKSKKSHRAPAKYDPMKSSVIQAGVVVVIVAALVLAYVAGLRVR